MTQLSKNQEKELLQTFIEETRANIDEIEKGILTLEKNPGDMEVVNHLLVQFHTVKGNSKFFGLNEMNDLCHESESLLEAVAAKKISCGQTIAESLFESEDVLKKLLEILLKKLPEKEDNKQLKLESEELIKPILLKLKGILKTAVSSSPPKSLPKTKDEILEKKEVKVEKQDEKTETASRSPAPDSETSLSGKFLTFRLDKEYYAFGVLYVQDIISMVDITPVPETANFVKGLINLRGKVIPVIDLRVLFEMGQAEYHKETCIIIIRGSKGLIGAIVDSMSEVVDLDKMELEEAPDFGDRVNTDYILGMAKANDEVKILLDIEKILNSGKMVVAD